MEQGSSLRQARSPAQLQVVEPHDDVEDRVERLLGDIRAREAARSTSLGPDGGAWLDAVRAAEERALRLRREVELARAELRTVRAGLTAPLAAGSTTSALDQIRGRLQVDVALRFSVLTFMAGLLVFMVWAGVTDYALRVTSDTPTFIALVTGMAERPFAEQSPFLAQPVATQHATPYMQAVAFLWSFLDGDARDPREVGRLLALIGIPVFALLLLSLFLYVRRLAGSRAAWLAVPVVLGLFGPPHVIWASDLTLHGALYASYFPQTLALALLLLTLFLLDRDGYASLVLACLAAAATMLVHPFSGVLLCLLLAAQSCQAAYRKDAGFYRGPLVIALGFVLGLTWPAYSLDRAFAETGLRGVFFVGLCVLAPLMVRAVLLVSRPPALPSGISKPFEWLASGRAAFKLAVAGAVGTAVVAAWELALVRSPPAESARLAIYWVDDRWRWPVLLVAGAIGLSGLARLALRGQLVPAIWLTGALGVGLVGAVGVPVPVWYRFLLLCQIPLAIGVAAVLGNTRQVRTLAIVAATLSLAIGVKVATLLEAPPTVTYFDTRLQAAWELGDHIPVGPGLVATDPKTAYFIPAATGRRVLTVDKGHVSSRRELAFAEQGYRLLRRYYVGGRGWWQAAQEMWRRGVRYVVVEKQTTLEPRTLADFTWQTARLRTSEQRRALGSYFYENGRVGTLVFDSPEYAIYRFDRKKLFGPWGRRQPR
jgi:hypothetical protein